LPRPGSADRPLRAPAPASRAGRRRVHSGQLRGRVPVGAAPQAGPPSLRAPLGQGAMSDAERLPILPLGQLVVYPHVVLPLAIDDARAVQLIDAAVQGSAPLLLGAMRPVGVA